MFLNEDGTVIRIHERYADSAPAGLLLGSDAQVHGPPHTRQPARRAWNVTPASLRRDSDQAFRVVIVRSAGQISEKAHSGKAGALEQVPDLGAGIKPVRNGAFPDLSVAHQYPPAVHPIPAVADFPLF